MPGQKILIVDDEQEALDLLEIELSTEGYQIIKASNGVEAIEQAKASSPDLVLMDIMMPDMDGAEAVRRLKSEASTKDIPVVFLTVMLTKSEEQKSNLGIQVENKMYEGISKPFNHEDLLEKVKTALEE